MYYKPVSNDGASDVNIVNKRAKHKHSLSASEHSINRTGPVHVNINKLTASWLNKIGLIAISINNSYNNSY